MIINFSVKLDIDNEGDEQPFIDEVVEFINDVGKAYYGCSVLVDIEDPK